MGSQRVGHNSGDLAHTHIPLYIYICIYIYIPHTHTLIYRGFPGGSDGKVSACNAGDPGSNPELGRSPGEGNENPPQYSCLENSLGRGV